MIDVLFEQRIIQNTGLAAETIWHAVQETYESKGKAGGVSLPLVFLVLPLTFHLRTARVLSQKTQSGAIFKALAEEREMVVGLQARMQAMSSRTWQALSIAFQTGLLTMDSNHTRDIYPGRKSSPVTHASEEVRMILNAAKRVGHAFGQMSLVQLSTTLNIRF
jgi:hypothetical protein